MNIQEARNNAHTASRALTYALNGGVGIDKALAALNAAHREAFALGAHEFEGVVTIVDGKPFSPSRITADRAAEIMANAARANGR